ERAPLYLFGWVDEENERVLGVPVPGMLSLLVHFDINEPVTGLDAFAEEDRPPLQLPFQAYHIMIACGMFFIGITLTGLFFLWRGTLYQQRWLLWILVPSVILPHVANQAGWIAAEVGRQPWIVYGLLRTDHAVSKAVDSGE